MIPHNNKNVRKSKKSTRKSIIDVIHKEDALSIRCFQKCLSDDSFATHLLFIEPHLWVSTNTTTSLEAKHIPLYVAIESMYHVNVNLR